MMFRLLLVLLLAVTALRPAHAQEYVLGSSAPPTFGSAGLRLVLDPRLVPSARVDALLAPDRAVDAPRTPALARDSHWKTGAVVGGVLGALAGFGLGYGMDNIINEGKWRVGENAVGGTVMGAVGGGLLGAGVGSLIRR
jgi:hypothetical protein